MKKGIKVFKFGGASVKDAEGVRNVHKILRMYENTPLLVVISAMGKMTNALEELTTAFYMKKESGQSLQKIRDYHLGIMHELFPDKNHRIYTDIENTFVEIEWVLEEAPHEDFNFVYDQVVSVGELLSTRIVSAYLSDQGLHNKWTDARSYIQTDNTYREGKVNWELSYDLILGLKPQLEEHIILTQGFIGGTSENYTTTLGREGSDYSAAIFAYCLDAESVTIWKDVPGVLTADPKLFPDAIKFDELTYLETIEMTYYGASVIHPKTIKPLQNKSIPLNVRSFYEPGEKGTVIGLTNHIPYNKPNIIVKKPQLLVSVSTKDYSFIAEENLSLIFHAFARHNIRVNMMQNSALSFSVCIDHDELKQRNLLKELEKDYRVLYNEGVELVTIRHYNEKVMDEVCKLRQILMEQRSRSTIQVVLK